MNTKSGKKTERLRGERGTSIYLSSERYSDLTGIEAVVTRKRKQCTETCREARKLRGEAKFAGIALEILLRKVTAF